MKCLFVVDVQNGFVSDKTKHIVPRIVDLMDKFSDYRIISTKFINNGNNAFSKIIHWHRLRESPETDLIPEIKYRTDLIVEKFTYTACTDEIRQFLFDNKVEEVYIVGIDTDCCVLKTAIDLFEMNIRPIVLTEYCASNGGKESHEAAIKVLKRTIGDNQISSKIY